MTIRLRQTRRGREQLREFVTFIDVEIEQAGDDQLLADFPDKTASDLIVRSLIMWYPGAHAPGQRADVELVTIAEQRSVIGRFLLSRGGNAVQLSREIYTGGPLYIWSSVGGVRVSGECERVGLIADRI